MAIKLANQAYRKSKLKKQTRGTIISLCTGMLAFTPVLLAGSSIQIHPLPKSQDPVNGELAISCLSSRCLTPNAEAA